MTNDGSLSLSYIKEDMSSNQLQCYEKHVD